MRTLFPRARSQRTTSQGVRTRHRLRRSAAAMALALVAAAPAAQAIEATGGTEPTLENTAADTTPAIYEGRVIDLRKSWEGATTCVVAPELLAYPECFGSDEARDARLESLGIADHFAEKAAPEDASFAMSYCSSYLKLYDGYSYGGASVWLSLRASWMNLADYGFNQRTSSYKVGGCSSIMADLANGGGAWISTSLTQAWDVDPTLSSTWNNDVSSVYIY